MGLGKSGVAATLLLRDHGVPVYASDNGTGEAYDRWADDPPASRRHSAARRSRPRAHRPGGRGRGGARRPAGGAAARGRAPGRAPRSTPRSTSDSWRSSATRCIGITGTNGKTTTTSLTAHLLVAGGLRAETAGNIGRPLSDVAQDGGSAATGSRSSSPRSSCTTRRISSRRSASCSTSRPITSTGITRSRSTTATRRCSSATPTRIRSGSATPTTRRCRRWCGPVRGTHLRFSLRGPSRWLVRPRRPAGSCSGTSRCWPRAELPLLGDHNVANALAAALAALRAGCPREAIAGRAPDLQRDPAPGRAGAGGGRGAVDQRLQVHQRHLHRGGDRRARPALRAAARRATQGRAVHSARGAARRSLPGGGGVRRGGADRGTGPRDRSSRSSRRAATSTR